MRAHYELSASEPCQANEVSAANRLLLRLNTLEEVLVSVHNGLCTVNNRIHGPDPSVDPGAVAKPEKGSSFFGEADMWLASIEHLATRVSAEVARINRAFA